MALTDNLIGYWKFDESSGNASDSSGAGLTLTNNGSTSYATGKINNGADLEQSSSNFFSSTSTSFNFTSAFTVSCWVKPESITALSYSPAILSKDSSGQGYNLRVSYIDSKINWVRHDSTVPVTSTTALSNGTWYFVAVTYDGTTIKLYVNGSEEASASYTAHTASGSDFRVGGSTQYSSRLWDGMIDEMGAWSRALSSAEVSSLYSSGSGLSYPFGGSAPTFIPNIMMS